MFKMKIGSK